LGFDFAVGPYAERLRVCAPAEFRPGNLEHPEWNTRTLFRLDIAVWSQPLTFDRTRNRQSKNSKPPDHCCSMARSWRNQAFTPTTIL